MSEGVGKLPDLRNVMQLMEAPAVDADHVPRLESAITDFEDAVWEVEGVRVVVRDRSDCRIHGDYGYERAAKGSWHVSELLNKRVRPVVDGREVAVVEGGGSHPHGKTQLRTVRASYRQ